MKKILLSLAVLLQCLSYSQNSDIENGTYVTKTRGQGIKLVLSDNNKYDLLFMSGKYQIKNDSIILNNSFEKKSNFDLTYTYGQNIKFDKIRIVFTSSQYDFDNIYIATFNGSTTPIYKRISDIQYQNSLISNQDVRSDIANFEIDRAEFIVLAKENYLQVTELAKFKLPENISQIEIKDVFKDDQVLKFSGIINKENKELTISENNRNPMIFIPESQFLIQEKNNINPIESKKITNWTYAGKEIKELEDTKKVDNATAAENPASDAVANATETKDFSLKIEKKLQDALAIAAKNTNKFLVIVYDPKNTNAQNEFNFLIDNQNTDLSYYQNSDEFKKYDIFNYYLASKTDEKWFKNNKIKTFPAVIVLNSTGTILSQANKSVGDLSGQFNKYSDFFTSISRLNVLDNFKKTISKNVSDNDLIQAFAKISALEIPYNPSADDIPIAQEIISDLPPPIEIDKTLPKIDEIKFTPPAAVETPDEIKIDPETTTVETPSVYENKVDNNVYTKIDFDQKLVNNSWIKIINLHKNDINPNVDLVVIIDKELKNSGFTKQLFGEEKILDESNFHALDYMFKHYDAIDEARKKAVYDVDAIYNIDLIETEIKNILNIHIRLLKPETPVATQEKIVTAFQKLIEKNNLNQDLKLDYFELLQDLAIKSKTETRYIAEYDKFFATTFDEKTSIIEQLNKLFDAQTETGTENWSGFKTSYANLSNSISWFVVQNSKIPATIKKAIKWSENSLVIATNNHYYLDTLAQLYYLNGEKTKAIATQQKAIDNIGDDDITEYKKVLDKMKDGSY